ncbi:MAG: class I SAM-dependent methyltransferase [Desulfovibrio sp.]
MGFDWDQFGKQYGVFNEPGFYYSPLPDFNAIAMKSDAEFAQCIPHELHGVDMRIDNQVSLTKTLRQYESSFPDYINGVTGFNYTISQDMFPIGDAFLLFSMMNHLKPKRVIEVGSGFSSGIMLDYNLLNSSNPSELQFIEPYPERLLPMLSDDKRHLLIQKNLQEIPLSSFDVLKDGDVLFIDSSHVCKHGSDVNYLLFEVLPSLNSGVYVHFHDIFHDFDYPKNWYHEGRAWNEGFMLRAFLQYNNAFKMIYFNAYMHHKFPELFSDSAVFPSGGSLWICRR